MSDRLVKIKWDSDIDPVLWAKWMPGAMISLGAFLPEWLYRRVKRNQEQPDEDISTGACPMTGGE